MDIVTFAHATVWQEDSNPIELNKLWREQTAILIFIRHFACVGCRAVAKQIWNDWEKYQKSGAKLYFIGNGSPHFIKAFKEDLKIEGATVLTDPSLVSFRAAVFRRGFLAALGPKSILNGVQLMIKGHKQDKYDDEAGDLWQLGGVVAVVPTGKVVFHHISEALGDYPPENDVIGQIE